jgi:futalosine hydrolase
MKHKYNADVESMEGAALHYVCIQKNIPFLQIRGISNQVGERDKSKWQFKEAIQSSNQLLNDIYSSLKK